MGQASPQNMATVTPGLTFAEWAKQKEVVKVRETSQEGNAETPKGVDLVKQRRDAEKKEDWEEGRKRRARWRPACTGRNKAERGKGTDRQKVE